MDEAISEEVWHALDQTSEIMITDPDGAILYVNDKLVEVCGYSREELLGKNPRLLKSGFHPESFYADLWSTLKRGEIWQGEIKNRHKNGLFYWMDTTISPLVAPDGRLTKFIAIRYDITRRKELEALKEEFIGVASHELRSPISTLNMIAVNFSEGLYGALSIPQKEAVLKLKKNTELLSRTASNLLDISCIESGHVKPKFQHLNAAEAMAEIISNFESVAEEQRLKLQIDISNDLPVLCMDIDMVRQVFSNLLSNAFRFARKKIVVRIRKTTDGVEINVVNDGPGIPKAEIPKLFQKFSRLEQTAVRTRYKGTGLGLAICKDIVEGIHKGKIWVENQKKEGVSFHFVFPLVCKCNL